MPRLNTQAVGTSVHFGPRLHSRHLQSEARFRSTVLDPVVRHLASLGTGLGTGLGPPNLGERSASWLARAFLDDQGSGLLQVAVRGVRGHWLKWPMNVRP